MKQDVEKLLLNEASFDELIKMKIEKEFNTGKKITKPKTKVITDIKKVPTEKIFSKNSVFRVYNRTNHSQSCINGIQADAMIGLQSDIREKILNKVLSAFSTDDTYVKFEKATITNV